MANLIDKDAVIAEINRRIKEHHSGYLVCLKDILSFLDTLEVKEADLVKEIINEEYLKLRRYGVRDNMLVVLNQLQFEDIANFFFRLGLKVQKGE